MQWHGTYVCGSEYANCGLGLKRSVYKYSVSCTRFPLEDTQNSFTILSLNSKCATEDLYVQQNHFYSEWLQT